MRKRGSMQDGKTHMQKWYEWLEKMKKEEGNIPDSAHLSTMCIFARCYRKQHPQLFQWLACLDGPHAENRGWFAELLAADCEEAWLHPGEEETMQKWYFWLEEMRKKDEKRKMEELHQQNESQLERSADFGERRGCQAVGPI